jgi:alkylation response protein AidB-like acyl-CoA dehydrogenase
VDGQPGPGLNGAAACAEASSSVATALQALVAMGADRLPLPGSGRTLERWRRLAAVAQRDLSLAKLYEGHTDALAILEELDGGPARAGAWGTWCAEPPQARLAVHARADGSLRLRGRKAWCSGAALLDHALVSGWNADGEPCLAAVSLRQPGVRVSDEGWPAVGMADSCSVDVLFDDAVATAVGPPHAYVRRPGFWHGGAGIAACWWGGAVGIARAVQAALSQRDPDPHQRAHLGAIDVALGTCAALLREAAAWIDRHPTQDAQVCALRVRLAVEQGAEQVLRHAGRALGAGPLCKQPALARAMADLPVFLRQSHAERDLAALGLALQRETSLWQL